MEDSDDDEDDEDEDDVRGGVEGNPSGGTGTSADVRAQEVTARSPHHRERERDRETERR